MLITKNIRNAVLVTAFTLFCVTNLNAYQINITVNDNELDFPLEGVKVSVSDSDGLISFTDENAGNSSVEIVIGSLRIEVNESISDSFLRRILEAGSNV